MIAHISKSDQACILAPQPQNVPDKIFNLELSKLHLPISLQPKLGKCHLCSTKDWGPARDGYRPGQDWAFLKPRTSASASEMSLELSHLRTPKNEASAACKSVVVICNTCCRLAKSYFTPNSKALPVHDEYVGTYSTIKLVYRPLNFRLKTSSISRPGKAFRVSASLAI